MRKTFGAIRSKEGLIIRNNNELQELIKGKDSVEYVTNTTNKIVGTSNSMKGVKLVKRITDCNPIGLRTKGRPKNRWKTE
jgi:hypothetical protein